MITTPLHLALATDLREGATLRDCRRVSHSTLEAVFNENMTREQYVEYGRALKLFSTALPYYRADWLKFGQKKFGADFVRETVEQLELPLVDVDAASALALVDSGHRSESLTPQHLTVIGWHIADGKLTAAEADKWILIAKEESLSVSDLTRSIEAGSVVKTPRAEGGHKNRDGVLTIHGIGTTFSRWLKNVEKQGGEIAKMPTQTKLEIMTEIEPIAKLHAQLKAEVAA